MVVCLSHHQMRLTVSLVNCKHEQHFIKRESFHFPRQADEKRRSSTLKFHEGIGRLSDPAKGPPTPSDLSRIIVVIIIVFVHHHKHFYNAAAAIAIVWTAVQPQTNRRPSAFSNLALKNVTTNSVHAHEVQTKECRARHSLFLFFSVFSLALACAVTAIL